MYADTNLLQAVADMFAAGTETTSTAIRWALLLFLHHPKVQERCHKEVMDVIGSGRAPKMEVCIISFCVSVLYMSVCLSAGPYC